MPIPSTGLCSDEDISIRAGSDLLAIAPMDQVQAAGNDGAFLNTDRWTLASATTDFVAQGVLPGMVAIVSPPKRQGLALDDQALVVASVGVLGMTLRRKGLAAGQGQPPSPVAGTSAVPFTVPTLLPQVLRATYEIDRRFGINEKVTGRRTLDLYDPDELRQATVMTVLWKLYQVAAQKGSADAKEGVNAALWAKARAAKDELDEVLARLSVHWTNLSSLGQVAAPTSRFSTRLAR